MNEIVPLLPKKTRMMTAEGKYFHTRKEMLIRISYYKLKTDHFTYQKKVLTRLKRERLISICALYFFFLFLLNWQNNSLVEMSDRLERTEFE